MIAVDTSALMAIVLHEPQARACADVLHTDVLLIISSVTYAEALIVSARRDVSPRMTRLLEQLQLQAVDVTPEVSRRIGEIYRRWGKGFHPAALNFGDCFAYDMAKQHDCPLLYVGSDFARTDIASALP